MSKTASRSGNTSASKVTSAHIQQQIDGLEQEIEDLQQRQQEIEELVADNWSADNSDLLQESSQLEVKLSAARLRRVKLGAQYKELHIAECLREWQTKMLPEYVDMINEENEALANRVRAEQLLRASQRAEEAIANRMGFKHNAFRKWFAENGITDDLADDFLRCAFDITFVVPVEANHTGKERVQEMRGSSYGTVFQSLFPDAYIRTSKRRP
jgi:hypothetical protein